MGQSFQRAIAQFDERPLEEFSGQDFTPAIDDLVKESQKAKKENRE